ncbi:hypothetical protein PG994_014099 [Apiospora phragmitis]|uniref:Uncharacterized protein n=1 Tax=Apiospora phragmitis TaxID=2905665 RepID=A0ABR1T3S7_9PEZI
MVYIFAAIPRSSKRHHRHVGGSAEGCGEGMNIDAAQGQQRWEWLRLLQPQAADSTVLAPDPTLGFRASVMFQLARYCAAAEPQRLIVSAPWLSEHDGFGNFERTAFQMGSVTFPDKLTLGKCGYIGNPKPPGIEGRARWVAIPRRPALIQ